MKYLLALFYFLLTFVFADAQKIDAALLTQAYSQQSVEFIILMQEQFDVSAAKNLKTKQEKGNFVFKMLQSTAQKSQASINQILEEQAIFYRSFYVVNAIYAKGDVELVEILAKRADVAKIMANPWTRFDEPVAYGNANTLQAREGIEWGVQRINADQVWAMGYTGQGIVVGGQDTGYDWNHPAIKSKYRGWDGNTADHNYNWHDAIRAINPLHGDTTLNPNNNPCGLDINIPCDDHNHGTHTIGTAVGDDGNGNQIGVAPGARWIGARNMERGYGSPATYTECFEWFLAPTDLNNENPNPDVAPHVINNSWGCPAFEGCNPSNWALMEMAVNNLRAAGIVVVNSAGNSGSGCNTVNTAAAIFDGIFAVGASQQNDTIASFSSRGSVNVDNSFRMKPNVSAPGVGVRSAVRNGGYQTWNGTSMAGPHVAGLVALIISANPNLAGQVDLIESIIEATAKPMQANQNCGDISGLEIPNNTYGYGRVNALAAVELALKTETVDTDEPTAAAKNVELFPNPSQAFATMRLNGFFGDIDLRIFNATGQLVQTLSWQAQGILLEQIDLSELPNGIYFYQLQNEETVLAGKIVKQ